MASDDAAVRERAMRRYERADAELHAGGGYAAEAEAAQIAASLGHRGPADDPAVAHPLGWSATTGRAGPHPVLRRRDAAARRADQPPRRRLDRLAARVPQGPQGRARGDQPRHGAARADRDQGVPPRRQPPGDRRLQHGLVGVPRPARDRRAAAQARAGERRAQGRPADGAGQQDAGQGDQGAGRAVHDAPGRAADGGLEAERAADKVARIKFPEPGAVRQDAAHRVRAVEVLRLARGVHRRRPGDRQGLAGSSSSASTVPARPRCCGSWPASTSPTPARSRRATGCKLGYYAQEHETLDTSRTVLENMQHGGARAHRHRGPLGARLVPVLRRRRRQAGRGAVRRREDPAGAGDPGRVQRQRAAARRADQQPRPGLPRGGAGRDPRLRRARSCW